MVAQIWCDHKNYFKERVYKHGIRKLRTKRSISIFEEICQVPHGTFDTKRISDYCVAFAKERGLACIQDETNNIIISKPGTVGYENSEPVIIQGHMVWYVETSGIKS